MLKGLMIAGGNDLSRLERANQFIQKDQQYDSYLVDSLKLIGIEEIRRISRWLSLKPYQANQKTVVIRQAEQLTIPAQNAFLKTLEEPPSNCHIILLCPNPKRLLPAIVSRCQIIRIPPGDEITLTENDIIKYEKLISQIEKASAGQRLILSQHWAVLADQPKDFLNKLIIVYRYHLRQKPSLKLKNQLQLLCQSLELLETNINVNLVFGNLFLDL